MMVWFIGAHHRSVVGLVKMKILIAKRRCSDFLLSVGWFYILHLVHVFLNFMMIPGKDWGRFPSGQTHF